MHLMNELWANIPTITFLSLMLIGAGLMMFVLGLAKLLTVWWVGRQ
jgi:hypothetical protein